MVIVEVLALVAVALPLQLLMALGAHERGVPIGLSKYAGAFSRSRGQFGTCATRSRSGGQRAALRERTAACYDVCGQGSAERFATRNRSRRITSGLWHRHSPGGT